MKTIIPKLRESPYESQIILLISSLAIIRMIVALIFDLTARAIRTAELFTDFMLLLVFGGLFLLGYYRSNVKSVSPLPAFVLILLLAINFLEFGGVHGDARFNYYGGFFVTILLYNGRNLVLLLVTQSILMITLVIYTTLAAHGTTFLFLSQEADQNDFIFILLSLGTLAFYFKDITEIEIKEQESLTDQLSERVKEAKKLNHEMVDQGQQLSFAQQHLESEVNRRSYALVEKQKAIQRYIHLNSQLLLAPMQQLNTAIVPIGNTLPLSSLLLLSHAELNEVLRNINATLAAREELNRNKVK